MLVSSSCCCRRSRLVEGSRWTAGGRERRNAMARQTELKQKLAARSMNTLETSHDEVKVEERRLMSIDMRRRTRRRRRSAWWISSPW
jgi:hypothetical protein